MYVCVEHNLSFNISSRIKIQDIALLLFICACRLIELPCDCVWQTTCVERTIENRWTIYL